MDAKNKNRTASIIVRVTDEEKALIEKKADERGLSLSGYVRMMVMGAKK